MTKTDLSKLQTELGSAEWHAQYVVESWESGFPDALDDSGRFLLYHFVLGACKCHSDELKAKLDNYKSDMRDFNKRSQPRRMK